MKKSFRGVDQTKLRQVPRSSYRNGGLSHSEQFIDYISLPLFLSKYIYDPEGNVIPKLSDKGLTSE